MCISPMRLGTFIVLIGLLAFTTPAHARRVRNGANNPQNPSQAPGQPLNIGDPQPAPASGYPTSTPYVNQNQYRTGAAQPAYTPNLNNQPRPQYQPNAYVPPAPNPYNPAVSNPATMPNTPPSAPASAQGSAAGNGNSFTVADQYPARPPRVSFRNGQLTILAENSTLPDILTAIHQRTGAALELPAALGSERVAAKLGPAPTGAVLADLLNGSRFDFIVLNRLEDPSSPERIILREKSKVDPNNPNGNGYNNGYNNMANSQPMYQPLPQSTEVPETVPEEEVPEQPEPVMQPGGDPNNPGNAKTPEQLLEELRMLQQQQRGPQPNQPQIIPQQPPLMDNNEPQ